MTEHADLVITGADGYTVDAARSWSDAIAVPVTASCATLAVGSDRSVTTANPLEEIEVAVTRVDPKHGGNAAVPTGTGAAAIGRARRVHRRLGVRQP